MGHVKIIPQKIGYINEQTFYLHGKAGYFVTFSHFDIIILAFETLELNKTFRSESFWNLPLWKYWRQADI